MNNYFIKLFSNSYKLIVFSFLLSVLCVNSSFQEYLANYRGFILIAIMFDCYGVSKNYFESGIKLGVPRIDFAKSFTLFQVIYSIVASLAVFIFYLMTKENIDINIYLSSVTQIFLLIPMSLLCILIYKKKPVLALIIFVIILVYMVVFDRIFLEYLVFKKEFLANINPNWQLDQGIFSSIIRFLIGSIITFINCKLIKKYE